MQRSDNQQTLVMDTPVPRMGAKTVVIQLIHTMAYGGVETIIIDWARSIDRENYEIHLVCFANPGETEAPFVEAAARYGLPVTKIPWSRKKPVLEAARALARLVRQWEAAIIHTHNVYADVVGLVAAKLTGAKTVATLYVWGEFSRKRNILQHIDRVALHFFDRITTQCESTQKQTLARGLPPDRTRVLTSGMDTRRVTLAPEERARRRHELGIANSEIVLANVARLYPEKAQDLLLRCFQGILRRCPEARLWILGVGPLEADLKAQCAALGLDHVVRFLGFVNDLPELLALVDVQVHPSWNEGVPIALCAGMAAGLPIVATAVGGVPEVLDHGHSGVLVPPGDETAFIDAVVALIRDSEAASRLGQAARRFIEEKYSIAASVRRLQELYGEVV
jgi:glycosyltransferase involved in cell wall biosynthesis